MTGNEYQILAARTINHKLNATQKELHALHLMASEVGEIHGLYQKVYQGHDFNTDDVKKELGDLLWGIAEFCTANGFEMDKIMELNIEKLRKRYPDGFSEERSLNREE